MSTLRKNPVERAGNRVCRLPTRPSKSAANCWRENILVDYRPQAGIRHFAAFFTIKRKNAISALSQIEENPEHSRMGKNMLQPRVRLEAMTSSLPGVPSFQLSIIIPSFNEELRLPGSLELIAAYGKTPLSAAPKSWVVDDGSKDRHRRGSGASFSDRIANLRVLKKRRKNRGKGFTAFVTGMVEAREAKMCCFTDADLFRPNSRESGQTSLRARPIRRGHRLARHESKADRSPRIAVSRILPELFSIVSFRIVFVASVRGHAMWLQGIPPRKRCRIIFEQQRH